MNLPLLLMIENETLPFLGEFSDRRGNCWLLDAESGGYLERGESAPYAVKDEKNEGPVPAAPVILSLLSSCYRRKAAVLFLLPCCRQDFLRGTSLMYIVWACPFGPGCRAAQGAGKPSPPFGLPSVTHQIRLQPAKPAPLFTARQQASER